MNNRPTQDSGVERLDEPARCPVCESLALVRRHCHTICPQCGYVESCEDNFIPNKANPQE